MKKQNISANEIRSLFTKAMSDMYKDEVPAYGILMDLVKEVNNDFLEKNTDIKKTLQQTENLDRIDQERHGAIRLGTAKEIHTIRRLFAVMGMFPVGYYDLSVANIPVHSTAFRPLKRSDLSVNPFRVFTSLLRLDLIEDKDLRASAEELLNKRKIFTEECIQLIKKFEKQGFLSKPDGERFVKEAVETFRWHIDACVDEILYHKLKSVHGLVTDVVSFQGPHINHLTPRTLDIDFVQSNMPKRGINPKAVIEGPPNRKNDILLRQTSFKALVEKVYFINQSEPGVHQARFGEIEQRGVALTPKGRDLYDKLLLEVRNKITPAPDGSNAKKYYQILDDVFSRFPDDKQILHDENYAYYEYHLKDGVKNHGCTTIQELMEKDLVTITPIVYEDFLPVSAAGIFQSNLGDNKPQDIDCSPQQKMFEDCLGVTVTDPFELYEQIKQDSIANCLNAA